MTAYLAAEHCKVLLDDLLDHRKGQLGVEGRVRLWVRGMDLLHEHLDMRLLSHRAEIGAGVVRRPDHARLEHEDTGPDPLMVVVDQCPHAEVIDYEAYGSLVQDYVDWAAQMVVSLQKDMVLRRSLLESSGSRSGARPADRKMTYLAMGQAKGSILRAFQKVRLAEKMHLHIDLLLAVDKGPQNLHEIAHLPMEVLAVDNHLHRHHPSHPRRMNMILLPPIFWSWID